MDFNKSTAVQSNHAESTNRNYPGILIKNNMKLTKDRLFNDFRETMREIVDVKNGKTQADGILA